MGSLTLALSVTLLDGTHSAAIAAPQNPKKPKSAAATQAADIPSARVAARLSGKRVEALSERSETSRTWVNKNGSLTTELTAGPARFQRDGEWVEVDVELREDSDGSVFARAHPAGLSLAGRGGTVPKSLAAAEKAPARDLVTLGEGDEQITLRWKGGLPKPELDGTRATYSDALPDADLIVEATRTGFEQFVELKERPAAKDYSYTLPLQTDGLRVRQLKDGSLLFTDKKSGKKKRAVMPAPVMWDASTDKVSGEHANRAKVDLKVVKTKDGVDLVVTPDADFLADPTTQYPVTVDPSTSALSNVFDTLVKRGETVDWSTNTELHLGNPGTTNPDGTTRVSRSFITWNTSPVSDALVSSAKLSLWNVHSGNADCKPYQWTVWETGAASTATRWDSQPTWLDQHHSSTETKGRAACGGPGWINADVTTLVQKWASAKATRGHMGLRAATDATTHWKQVSSANAASNQPKLVVTYNYRPRTGTKQEAGPPYFSYSGAYTVNTVTPTLRDTFVDADGDKVNGTFQIFDSATDTQVGNVLVSPFVPSGQVASVTVPSGVLTDGKTYKFRTSPYDGAHYNTGWSAWKTFTVDAKAPSAPTKIVSTDYPTDKWVKGAGQAGTFTVTPPAGTDHHWLEWSLDGVEWTKVTTSGSSANKAISIAPPKDGSHTLQVRAVDKADNKSEPAEYIFHAGPGGFIQPADGERTARRLPLVAEADGTKYDKVSFSWRRSEADPWVKIPAGDVTADGTPLTAWPVALTNGKNAPLVWNATDTVDPDGTVQMKADFTGSSDSAFTQPLSVIVDRNASGAADDQVGPGSLNLLTGDYTLSANDASAFGLSVSRTASSRAPDKEAKQEGQAPIFGKEWVSGAVAEATESDYSHIHRISDTAVAVVDTEGEETHFTANAAKTGWIPETGSEFLTLTGGMTSSFTLSDTEGAVTTFTKTDAAATTWQVSSVLLNGLTNSATTVVSETVTVDGEKLARPKRIIAPTSAASAATCTATPSTKGCRALEFIYATTTTATANALGDITGQVKEIRLWSTEPGAGSATSKAVQAYLYDESGRLRETWDPQISPTLTTAYGYDAAGRVTRLTPPGELPWSFAYGKAGNAATAGDGMLLKASRSGLKQGTRDVEEGTASTSIVYDVPLTGATAPYKMGAADVKAWGQLGAPTDATAVFPADAVPASHSGNSLGTADYKRAEVHYLGVSGREVNLASPGGHISTTEYDRFGNTVRELSASNRAVALGLSAADRSVQDDLGIGSLATAERSGLLAVTSVYDEAGTREIEKFGPLRRVNLTADLKSGTTTLVAVGTSVTARSWVVNEYDSGRPTDGTANIKDQLTKSTAGAQVREHPGIQAETRTSQISYDWTKGLPTKTVHDPSGLAVTNTTEYDAQGRITKQIPPGATGTDAATRVTAYWSATGTGTCQGRPEWADLVCSTGPAGAITGGGSNPSQMPASTTEYGWWGNPVKVTETANGVTRTTTTTYDNAGRQTKTATTGGVGQAVPESTTDYDPANGQPVKTTSATGGTITRAYDKLGRIISYTDADSGVTTTEYDLLDRPVKTADNSPSTVTHTYDHAVEPRGLVTKTTDSVAGVFQTGYNADGSLSSQKLPGGYTLRQTEDTTGAPLERTYTRDSDSVSVMTDTVTRSVFGQVTDHAGWSDQTYAYDKVGRLATVEDTFETVCTKRTYAFDNRSNRKSLTAAAGAPGLDCPTTGGNTTSHTYDSADRIVDTGYTYDAFGRTTVAPDNGTIGYYANDLVHQQTANGKRQTWQLDASLRFRSWKTETGSGSTWTQTGSKVNHYDSDSDSPRWVVEDTATGALTRYVTGADGRLAATTAKTGQTVLQLTNIRGDISLLLPLDTGIAPTVLDADEYGNSRAGQTATRYGWLGSYQRSGETVTGLTLMGVRLYDPAKGRFLSVDPVAGGSCNSYDYVCADPVNMLDLDGRMTALALVGAAGLGVSAGTALAIIGVAAVVAIIGLIWWYGKAWAIRKVKTLYKEAKKSGKEKGNDVPNFARGQRRLKGESLDKATDRVMRGGNHRPPYKKGPGSIYNKVRKYLSRN